MSVAKKARRGRVKMTYHSSSSEDEADVETAALNGKDQLDTQEPDVEDHSDKDDDDPNLSDSDNGDGSDQESGWANAISKVLHTKVNKKSFILSKAKMDRDIVIRQKGTPQPQVIEILGEDGKVTVEKSAGPKAELSSKTAKEIHQETLRKEWENMGRVKPIANNDKEKEIYLNSIATKGVVQLFNAVNQQQQKIKEKLASVGKLEQKRDKALASFTKKDFLDRLKDNDPKEGTSKQQEPPAKGNKKQKNSKKRTSQEPEEEAETKKKKGWKVLQDDFVPNAKIKDWDNEDEQDSD